VITRPVTLVRRTKGAPDALGNDTWTTSASTVQGVYVPGTSVEQIQARDSLVVQASVLLPAGTDLRHLDSVVIDGTTFDVDGEPIDWEHPLTGWRPGVQVNLRRAEG
jgi:hypothetical protein